MSANRRTGTNLARRGSGLAVALLALCALSRAGAEALQLPPGWTAPTDPFELFDGVYWVGTETLAAFLFTSEDGHVLLDVGMPEAAPLVAASIEALGFDVGDVRYLLNTQAHFDHSGGFAEMKRLTGAELLAAEGDRYALEEGTYEGWEERTAFDFPPVEVDRVLTDGEVVRVGDVALTAIMTPGHSPGCTSWAFVARDGEARHDAIVFCSASVAANRLHPDPQYPGIVEDYRATFARMRELDFDVFLAPHAEQFGLAEKRARIGAGPNPFVDPSETARRMAAFERDFEAALAAQRAAED